MATLHSIATGNFSSSSTWAVVDANSYLDARNLAAGTTLSTSPTASSTFTFASPTTIQGVSVQLVGRVDTPSGTITLQLFNATSSSVVTSVTLNVSDLPNTTSQSRPYIGWTYFAFSSPVVLATSTNYSIRLNTSVATQVNCHTNAVSNNWSRALVTTTTAAPVATDILITGGFYSGAGLNSTCTVTMDITSTATTYGNIYVGSNGFFRYGTAASTNYALKIAGNIYIGRGGTFSIGTASTPIPATSTAVLEINCASNLQFQIFNFGNFETKHETTITYKALFAANTAVGATSATTDVSTAWRSGDVILMPGTSARSLQIDRVTLNANAVGTTITHNATTFAHDGGTSNLYQGDIFNLTRNIRIISTTGPNRSQFQQGRNGVSTIFDVEFFEFIGPIQNESAQSALNIFPGSFNMRQCTFWQLATPLNGNVDLGAQVNLVNTVTQTISNNIFYNFQQNWNNINDGNVIIGFWGFNAMQGAYGSNNIFTNCNAAGCNSMGFSGASNNRFYGIGGNGAIYFPQQVLTSVSYSAYTFFNNSVGIRLNNVASTAPNLSDRRFLEIFDSFNFYGNSIHVDAANFGPRRSVFNNCFFWGGRASVITAIGFTNFISDQLFFTNCTFGRTRTGVDNFFSTSCLRGNTFLSTFTNCSFFGTQVSYASSTYFTTANGTNGIVSLNHNGVVGDNRIFQSNGSLQTDSTILYNNNNTLRITPAIATNKTFSNTFRVPVNSGSTCTISVAIRKSYNSNLITFSETFSNASWTRLGTSLSANTLDTLDPINTNTATKVTESTSSSSQSLYWGSSAILAQTYTFSIYAKAAERSLIRGFASNAGAANSLFAYFNLTAGTVTGLSSTAVLSPSANITLIGNGWYRCSLTATWTAATTLNQLGFDIRTVANTSNYAGTSGFGIYSWGAQLNSGSLDTYYSTGLASSVSPYNGNAPRLMYVYNPFAGNNTETVGGSASGTTDSWEILTYTTPTVSNTSVLEFYVDCDGTTGWINMSDFRTTTANDTRSLGYWSTLGVYAEPDYRQPGGTYTFIT